jgi:hypothetical protein
MSQDALTTVLILCLMAVAYLAIGFVFGWVVWG